MKTIGSTARTRAGKLRRGVVASVATVVMVVCGGGSTGNTAQAQTAAPAVSAQPRATINTTQQGLAVFSGQAHTVATVTDVYGRPTTKEYFIPVTVQVNSPVVASTLGRTETNPFNLLVTGVPGSDMHQEGLYTLISAVVAFQGQPGRELLIQYWNLTQNGQQFSGQLVYPANDIAASLNLINLPWALIGGISLPFVYGFAQGAAIAGNVNPSQISFHLQANTLDGAHPTISDVIATRVQ